MNYLHSINHHQKIFYPMDTPKSSFDHLWDLLDPPAGYNNQSPGASFRRNGRSGLRLERFILLPYYYLIITYVLPGYYVF